MKDYLGVYIKFLIVLGALLIGGLLLQSFTSGQGRTPRDETAAELRRQNLNNRWISDLDKAEEAKRAKQLAGGQRELVEYLKHEKMWEAKRKTGEYLSRQREMGIKAAAQQQADKLASLQWETVTIRMRRYGYEPELVQQEMADLEKLIGGKLAPKSLERCEDGVYKATFQWVER